MRRLIKFLEGLLAMAGFIGFLAFLGLLVYMLAVISPQMRAGHGWMR